MIITKLEDILSLDDPIIFNLILTDFCNYACGHCFYFSGPDKPKKYMDDKVLERIADYLDILRELFDKTEYYYFRSNVNLIGGESTVNIKKFENIVYAWIDTWLEYGDVESTTNGSWLERPPKQTIRVLKLYQYIMGKIDDYWGVEFPVIRISSDKYHEEFRKYPHRSLKMMLQEWEYNYEVCACGGEISYDEENEIDICEDCGEDVEFFIYEDINKHIYVEENGDRVIPTGRAANLPLRDPIIMTCDANTSQNILTIDPDGNITDMCCRGSKFTGNILTTSPIHIFYAWNRLKYTSGYLSCDSCNANTERVIESMDIDTMLSSPILLEDIGVIIYPDGKMEDYEN